MAVTRRVAKTKNGGRRKQFGVRLEEGPAEALIAGARSRGVPPTTLAAEILEQALADEALRRPGTDAAIAQLQEAVTSLAFNHHQGLVKLLGLAGMSRQEILDWKASRLKR